MQLIVLLLDHEEITHRTVDLELHDQTNLRQLKQQLSSILHIDPLDQKLFFEDGREISGVDYNDQLPKVGLRHLDKLIVKHFYLLHWTNFGRHHKHAQEWKQQHQIKAEVDAALQLLKLLKSAKFFLCYPLFEPSACTFTVQFAHYLDGNKKFIEFAANDYFSKFYNDDPEYPQIQIKYEPKEHCGAQGGVICEVFKRNVTLGKFHLKSHLGTASHSAHHTSPDLRELFVYRLLERINIGPEVHFLPNTHYSTFALYIATRDVVGFRRALEARSKISSVHKLQLELLSSIFYLTDLHSANYGLDSEENLYVVDFQVGHHAKSADVNTFLQCNREERIQKLKLCFIEWDLANNVDEVNQRISVQKALFEEKNITFLPSRDYNDYLSQIRKNITMFEEISL